MQRSLSSRFSVGTFVLCALVPSAVHGQSPLHEELAGLNRDLLESTIVRRDSTAFLQNTLTELVIIPPGGIIENRAQALAGLRAFQVTSIQLSQVSVAVVEGTAVVTAKLELEGRTVHGLDNPAPLRVMSVFTSTPLGWKLLARSLTPCSDRAIRADRC